MWLTALNLDSTPAALSWLSNPYHIHQRLWKAFPAATGKQPFLYFIDMQHGPRILVQSQEPGDWERVLGGQRIFRSYVTKEILADRAIRTGAKFRFSLLANPTRTIKDYRTHFAENLKEFPANFSRAERNEYAAGKAQLKELVAGLSPEAKHTLRKSKSLRKKKVGIYDQAGQLAWIARQGEQYGFRLLATAPEGPDATILTNPGGLRHAFHRKGGHRIKFFSIHFQGVLEISDSERFLDGYRSGIGSGKAFGCGLLLISRFSGGDTI
ncbi:MAG: type I-E CRISPR-associated protein Cas6/Cse3/CasE [Spirochaetales bacterium]|nr:type I-E CRISPR-associated protein Cas6/Cse3/CasE [Spirochaetales bacterium]